MGWYQTVEERAKNLRRRLRPSSLDPASTVSYMLTADTNIIHLAASATYRITKPITFYFDFADAAQFITNDLNNALLYRGQPFHGGRHSLQASRPPSGRRWRRGCANWWSSRAWALPWTGWIPSLRLRGRLLSDFNKVIQASTEHDTTLSQAEIYRSQTLGDARGQKEARTNTAAADTARMVGLLGAEQTNFSRLLGDYERNPALVTSLLQAETFKRVWANAQSTFVLPD